MPTSTLIGYSCIAAGILALLIITLCIDPVIAAFFASLFLIGIGIVFLSRSESNSKHNNEKSNPYE